MIRSRRTLRLAAAGAIVAALAGRLPARAEDQPQGWTDSAELSFVATAGNARTQTLGFSNKLARKWERSDLEIKAGGVRAESTTITRFAVGSTAGNFEERQTSETKRTAENYYLNGRFDRKISDRFFWFAGGGWDRNEFAGIQNRYTAGGGVGNVWVDSESLKFRTDYAATYTKQDDVVRNPDVDDSFAGLRASWSYLHKFGANTVYTNDLVVDDNLENTPDYRADMINSVAVSMSKRLALKVTLRWLYDNRPSFESVELFDPAPPGPPQDSPTGEKVLVELDKLDTTFTASLVISF